MDKNIIYIDSVDTKSKFESPDSSHEKSKLDLKKFFSPKVIKIVVLVLLAIVGAIILLGTWDKSPNSSVSGEKLVYGYRSTMDYCGELESKLQSVLSGVKGAGNVKVMLTLDGSPELVYASDIDEKETTNQNGTSTKSKNSSPIIVSVNGSNEPLILTEYLPPVKGVIIVSSGAKDIGVRLDILNAVSILLDITDDKIIVLNGN